MKLAESHKGIGAMALACVVWGLSPIYYKLLLDVPPLEILSHRTLWSAVFFGLILLFQGRISAVWLALRDPSAALKIALAAVFISFNWLVFIYSVQVGRVVEASLGYFILPLFGVALGYILFGERLGRLQWLAVGLAASAVGILTLALGVAPWISLALAASSSLYPALKKSLTVRPMVSVTGEVLLLSPLAVIWLYGVHQLGWTGLTDRPGGFFGSDWQLSLVLIGAGPLTATPLLLWSYAAKRLSLASLGLVQYINPTLQFIVATLVFQEVFTLAHSVTFALIWLALALYSFGAFAAERSRRRAVSRL